MPDNQELQSPGSKEPLRRVVDSTIAIAFARFFMPVVLAVIGWFLVTTITDMKSEIRDGNAALWSVMRSVQTSLIGQATDIAVLKQSKDETTKAVDRLTGIVDKLNSKP